MSSATGNDIKSPNYESWSSAQLIERIHQLESQISSQSSVQTPSKVKRPTKEPKPFDFDKHPTRYIALKYAYLGWGYSGLAYNFPTTSDSTLPTVESELFAALQKTRLIRDIESCRYSRCGRTDKGVSSMGQVSSLIVRSNILPQDRLENGGRGYTIDETNGKSKGQELDYLQILNGVLPKDIRVLAWSPISEDFDARFSCKARHYRYFFSTIHNDLDTFSMQKAAAYFLGEHDFRNFCKLDVQKQIQNFTRRILKADIVQYDGKQHMWMLELHGTAFLWHQVRCMMAILFLVGQRLEEPEIVRDLLDVSKFPTKPAYDMAHDVPLVLYNCVFEGLDWRYSEESGMLRKRLERECFAAWHEFKLKETVAGLMCKTVTGRDEIGMDNAGDEKITIFTGEGNRQPLKMYQKLAKRKRQDPFEVRNERYTKTQRYERQQKKRKTNGNGQQNEDIMEAIES